MIKAIVFDCFGVIITDVLDTMITQLHGNDPQKADRIVNLVSAATRGKIDTTAYRTAVAAELGISLPVYLETIAKGEVRNEPLLRYIKTLRKDFRMALLSNVSRGGLEARFSRDELTYYFDVVIASGDIGFAKPEAQAYEITADKLGVRLEECIMVDDREVFCQGAMSVGMQAIRYETFKQVQNAINDSVSQS